MILKKYPSYDAYLAEQIRAGADKRNQVWAQKNVLDKVVTYLADCHGTLVSGICHGVRTGFEVNYLKKFLRGDIFGTDLVTGAINPNIIKPKIIQWDFHEVKKEWLGVFDFIYSNALDHSCKPRECLKAWLSCLKPGGTCFIEWSIGHQSAATGADCFSATLSEYMTLAMPYLKQVIFFDAKSGKHKRRKTRLLILEKPLS